MAILCAVDFSHASGLALVQAARIADTFTQPLVIATVADPLLAAAEGVASGEAPLTLLRQALGEFVDDTLGAGSSTRHDLVVPVGDPAAEILRMADERDGALVVLATQGASGLRKAMFGSVAERVLRNATRPVLVVPPAVEQGPMRTLGALQEVLAPVAFHDHTLEDVRVASRIARASHAALRLLHVVPGDGGMRWSVMPPLLAAQLEAQWSGAQVTQSERARQALEAVAASLDTPPVPVLEVVDGSAAERIADVADRADVDLIVMGLRGVPGVLGARVGSVAYRVLCASPVPVLAVPHEARAGSTLGFLTRA